MDRNSRSAFLFPGQGAYVQGLLPRIARKWPSVRHVFRSIDATCVEAGILPVSDILDDPDGPTLEALVRDLPDRLQLILYGTSVACFHLLRDLGYKPFRLIGHSFGEIAALTCGGAFSIEDGARIVHARSRALASLSDIEGAMLVVSLDADRARALERLIDDPLLRVACYNAPRQSVLSGPPAALRSARAILEALGPGAKPVASPYPFHNPMLAPAVDPFAASITGLRQRPLAYPVFSPILGRLYDDRDDLPSLLARHLVQPVGFADAVRLAYAAGVERFIECGAQAALTGLATRSVPSIQITAPLASVDSLEAALRAARLDADEPVPAPASSAVAASPAKEAIIISLEAHQPMVTAQATTARRDNELAEAVRGICASYMGYPPEVFEDDVDLEADLGIDSLKRAELELTLHRHFGLADEGRSLTASATFGELVAAIAASRATQQLERV